MTGELTKATIIDTVSGAAHPVMYNPEEYRFEQGNHISEVPIPGLPAPPVQYVRGKSRTLSMELFFDSYESGRDVREFTGPIVALLDQNPATQAPPVLLFSMGRVQFRCVLVEAGQRYTMFLSDGTPVRSSLSVRLQEYVDVRIAVERGLYIASPTARSAVSAVNRAVIGAATRAGVLPPGSSVHLVLAGETLSGIAGARLGDPARWREIAAANGIDDPLALAAGMPLVIPASAGAR